MKKTQNRRDGGKVKKRSFTKIALTFSVCLLVLWAILGAGTTLAWFKDETPIAKNTFDIQELDLVVSHKVGDSWAEIDEHTELFGEEALYEPGYTQVVYLRIENRGEVDFDYKLSVDMISFVAGQTEMGTPIYLPDYLMFGTVIAENEIQLNREVARIKADKKMAAEIAMEPLNTYSTELGELDAMENQDSMNYVAIVIYMPEEIGNEANYRGDKVPEVQLGITVKASQRGTLFD